MERVPEELWTAVFAHLPLFWDRIRVAHVCAAWWKFALRSSTLWNCVDMRNFPPNLGRETRLAIVKEMLRRTGDARTTLIIADLPPSDDSTNDLLTRHMRHFEELAVNFSEPLQHVLQAFLNPAPMLWRLTLVDGRNSLSPSLALPRYLFAGNAPCLEHIDIGSFELPEYCRALENVRSLQATPSSPRALANLFTVLPKLEFLSVFSDSLVPVIPPQPVARTLDTVVLAGNAKRSGGQLRIFQVRSLVLLYEPEEISATLRLPPSDVITSASVICVGSHGPSRTLHWNISWQDGRTWKLRNVICYELIDDFASRLGHLFSLHLSANIAVVFARTTWHLPALKLLVIHRNPALNPFVITSGFVQRHGLSTLPQGPQWSLPRLRDIIIEVGGLPGQMFTVGRIKTVLVNALPLHVLAQCSVHITPSDADEEHESAYGPVTEADLIEMIQPLCKLVELVPTEDFD